ncbi:GIY-YIG nuclease family protein [Methylorubrum populi]
MSRRISEHKAKAVPGFTERDGVDRLVWYEVHDRIDEAIAREKALKTWRRAWKIALMEAMNPD